MYGIDFYHEVHSFAVNNNLYKRDNTFNNYRHIFDKYNVLAGDAIKVKISYRHKDHNGKNIASILIHAIYDISYGTDCDDHDALLEHNLTKQDFIIFDRYYYPDALFKKFKAKTKFLACLKANLKCVNTFMKGSIKEKNTCKNKNNIGDQKQSYIWGY